MGNGAALGASVLAPILDSTSLSATGGPPTPQPEASGQKWPSPNPPFLQRCAELTFKLKPRAPETSTTVIVHTLRTRYTINTITRLVPNAP